jgi:1,2-diacylglycerol 3-beta-galactosyltransferase
MPEVPLESNLQGRRTPAPREARTLLFLVADTGGGHRAAATAVARQMTQAAPGHYRIHILDPFRDASARLVGRITGSYSPIIRFAPWMWGALFHATDSATAVAALNASVLRLIDPGLRDVVRALSPAAVVSFHPLLNHASARILDTLHMRGVAVVTVVTDLVDVHAAWLSPRAHLVLCPTPEARARALHIGLHPDRCIETGLPVDSSFGTGTPGLAERATLRRRLGLRQDGFTILLTGGAEGSGGLLRRARALLHSWLPAQIVVICGRNRGLRQRLLREPLPGPAGLRIEAFVNNMADWMRASDLLVCKAGPTTLAEALCCGLPILISAHVPGQEWGNIAHVVASGAGRHVPSITQMVEAVAELSAPGSPALARMRQAGTAAARPQAAGTIAALLARAVGEPLPSTPSSSPPLPLELVRR